MDLQFTTVKEIEFNFSEEEFWSAVQVWISKPHTLNKRVLSFEDIADFISKAFTSRDVHHIIDIVSNADDLIRDILSYQNKVSVREEETNNHKLEIRIRKLIPRNETHFDNCVEMVISDPQSLKVAFFNISPHQCKPSVVCTFPYMLHFNAKKVYLQIESISVHQGHQIKECTCETHRTKAMTWLQDTLLPKLIKWAANSNKHNELQSLQLVDNMSHYSSLYNELKVKYGKEITQIWPEVTDPSKFVYEDLAIASYLMLLWQRQATSFVDLGCGNGLLVHILNSEGHKGFGVDVRKRKIWDMYPSSTILKVTTISPSSTSALFPDTEWIIGNHSDELTPWIPVIASRSHKDCKMFLLPCCAYQFNGRKYQRRNSKLSVYNDYLNYIAQDICNNLCQLNVERDRLRIPSTKRIAIVCRSRQYKTRDEYERVDAKIDEFLKRLEHVDSITNEDSKETRKDTNNREVLGISETNDEQGSEVYNQDENRGKRNASNEEGEIRAVDNGEKGEHKAKRMKSDEQGNADEWMKDVKTRETKEVVRNCTQINKSIVQTIVNIIVDCLLSKQLGCNSSWRDNNDYQIPMKDIIKAIQARDGNLLRELSKQNGGIKTLMRNKHEIFLLIKDNVQFRKPAVRDRNEYWKSKPCWFQLNHPFRCSLSSDECSFIH